MSHDPQLATLFAVAKLAESRDEDTGKHLERTRTYCKLLASELRKNPDYAESITDAYIGTIYDASPLHDIGKIAIPDGVLCKPGKLTNSEFELMKSHTARGAETLASVEIEFPTNSFIRMAHEIVRFHHEKWDGTGYPDRLVGKSIPLAARIMAIADVYDALTSKRCYKEAFTHDRSREIIQEGARIHFDPEIVAAFVAIEGEIQNARDHYSDDDQVHESRRWERGPQ